MQRLVVFNQVSLDGYFTTSNGDIAWAHKSKHDAEWNAFVAGNASGGGTLLFGRITYQLMASYWPTPLAVANDPIIANRMNDLPKVVFSKTLAEASWNNSKLVKNDLAGEIRRMKQAPGEGMAILGSGSIVSQLAHEGVIDEIQIVVVPVALGSGRTLFEGIRSNLSLRLTKSRTFENGNVLLCYEPVSR